MQTELLRRAVAGGVFCADDAGYDDARAIFNAVIDRRPVAIARPRSTDEVSSAVRWARTNDVSIAIRGGGHSVAGHAMADGALVIDLRSMTDVHVDPAGRRARVGGGAQWEHVDRATEPFGLAMPGGTFWDTGVGGLALGGGIGYLLGTAGLTCDNLMRATVVVADGSIMEAGPYGDPELLWALRGGGGNFGIVTEFEFALQPVGRLYAGKLSVPMAAASEALAAVAALAQTAPHELALFAGGPSHDDHALALSIVYQGDRAAAEAVIRPLRSLPIVGDTLADQSYVAVQTSNELIPSGLRHYWKGHFLRDLDPGAISATVGAMEAAIGLDFVLLEAITGTARDEPPGGAAFGQRAARWNVSGLAIWESADEDRARIEWCRTFADALGPSSLSGAGYANYAPVDETDDRVRAAFGTDRFERLVGIKDRYDPDNVFRFNLNIPPTGASASPGGSQP